MSYEQATTVALHRAHVALHWLLKLIHHTLYFLWCLSVVLRKDDRDLISSLRNIWQIWVVVLHQDRAVHRRCLSHDKWWQGVCFMISPKLLHLNWNDLAIRVRLRWLKIYGFTILRLVGTTHMGQLVPNGWVLDLRVVPEWIIVALHFWAILLRSALGKLTCSVGIDTVLHYDDALLAKIIAVLDCTLDSSIWNFVWVVALPSLNVLQRTCESSSTYRNRLIGILKLVDLRGTNCSTGTLLVLTRVHFNDWAVFLQVVTSASVASWQIDFWQTVVSHHDVLLTLLVAQAVWILL